MNKYKKLINNSIIFTVGDFGSRLISLLMVPLYTHILSTSEYGTVDLMNTSIGFLIPLLTLELGQAALRFTIDEKDNLNQNRIFSNISTHVLIVTILALFGLPILSYLNIFGNYGAMFIVLLILRVANNIYSQYTRGVGLVKEYALNGILMTLVTVISNIFLLVYLKFKVEGYILSLIFAALASNIYLLYISDGLTKIKNYNFDRGLLKEMLAFSIPIIPNSAMWWIINGSTRYFVLYFIGAAGNGIYAVANKIPALISMATGIFSQAWQLSSFEEYESETKDEFYTKTFNIYSVVLFIAGSAILVILKPLLSILLEDSFYVSWQIAPLLIFAAIYQSFSQFLGTNYTAAKETKGTFSTSVYAGIISIISSVILIPIMGLVGAGLSSALSLFAMFYIRLIDTQKYVKIALNKTTFIFTNFIFAIQTITLFITDGIVLFALELVLFLLLLYINKDILLSLLKEILDFFNKRRRI